MLSQGRSRFVKRRRSSSIRALSLATFAMLLSVSTVMAQGGGMCSGGGGAGGGGRGGGTGGTAGGQQSTGGGPSGANSLTTSTESFGARAAIAGQQMRQAQQAQVDQMAKVRRDVQQAAQQRVQLRTAALQARLAREELLAETAAKAKTARQIASKKSNSFMANTVASAESPAAKFSSQ